MFSLCQQSAAGESDLPTIRSVHGFTYVPLTGQGSGADGLKRAAVKSEIWSVVGKTRTETISTDMKVISIQLGGDLYTFAENRIAGERRSIKRGLAKLSLVEQIELVKTKGKREETYDEGGEKYVTFAYRVNFPDEIAIVLLNARTSLPLMWVSAVRTRETTAEALTVHYRDMEANIEIGDEMFEIPDEVIFVRR